MNILIPMGGKGLRFRNSGMSIPKPLIDIDGTTMINRVIDSIQMKGHFIYVHRQDYADNYLIDRVIDQKQEGEHFYLEQDNEGQTQTCLLAESAIDNDTPLFIVNCDNYLVWDQSVFNGLLDDENVDGAAFTFIDPQKRSHWCFAELDSDGNVSNLVEKQPISEIALAGGFYWRKGSDFVKYAKQLIEEDERAKNGEFYLGAVFNLAIKDGKTISNYKVDDMQSLGTPEEVLLFQEWMINKQLQKETPIMNRNIQDAINELRAGKPIILIDEHDRENEGDIVISAETVNSESLIFAMNKARGLMCVPCDGRILDRLEIPMMVENNTDKNETPFTVSVDSADDDCTTGMSVFDRLSCLSKFTDPHSKPSDLNRPGHLFPLRPKEELLKERRGHTEGSIELMKIAGLQPVAIIVEIMNDDGTMANGGQINKFATENGLTLITIEELYESVYGKSL